MSQRRPGRKGLSLLAALALAAVAGGRVGGQIPPDEQWRSLRTPHFRVTYPVHLPDLGRRAGERAERAYEALSDAFLEGAGGTIELIVTDHEDTSNGFASVAPRRQITIYARPPMDGFDLSYFDDWIELVVTHELAHVFHLDATSRIGSALRRIFGRVPIHWPVFPALGAPSWTVEGLATYYESALTHAGRLRGSYHEMVLRTAIAEHRFERLDQASGESPQWPGGSRPYIYGSMFFQHLVERHGSERVADFTRAVAGQWIPYRLNAAALRAFGVSFSEAWREWEAELQRDYELLEKRLWAHHPITQPEVLTVEGWTALYPAVSPDGARIAYARYDGRSDTQIRVLSPDGGPGEKLVRANGLPAFSWTPSGGVVFSQAEFVDSYRWRRDLYQWSADGGVRRVTRGARISHPDVSRAGHVALGLQEGEGTNRLVTVDLEDGRVEAVTRFRPNEHWAFPRWSPDGRWIAAIRWRPGAFYDLVILDAAGEVVQEVTADRALDRRPTWSPDGRWLLWSSDRTGIPNLFAVAVDAVSGLTGPVRQVTNMVGGAVHPEVGPDHSWIYFSSYHAHGWQVERVPFDPSSWFDPMPTRSTVLQDFPEAEERFERALSVPDSPYRARHTALPDYWLPVTGPVQPVASREVLGRSYGALTSGQDLVGRHVYAGWVAWRPGDGRNDGMMSYSYRGFGNPVIRLAATQDHDAYGPLLGDPGDGAPPDTLLGVERERRLGASVTLVRRRWRNAASLSVGGGAVWEERSVLELDLEESVRYRPARPRTTLAEASLSGSFSNVRAHLFSISAEDGLSGFLRVRTRWDVSVPDSLRGAEKWDRGFDEVTGGIRLYKSVRGPGFANHVLAVRGTGGVARGPGADAFHFDLGGAAGSIETILGVGSIGGGGGLFPLRGIPGGHRSGRYAWSASAEYRFPLALVHRGIGVFPLYFDRLSGSVFVDAGNAWGAWGAAGSDDTNPRRGVLTSAGAELLAGALPFWTSVLTFRFGLAVPLVDEEGVQGGTFYVRLGTSF